MAGKGQESGSDSGRDSGGRRGRLSKALSRQKKCVILSVAGSEVLGHLDLLAREGRVVEEQRDGVVRFRAVRAAGR